MGFFSSLIKVVGGIGRTLLGIPTPAAPAAAVARTTGLGVAGVQRLQTGRRVVQGVAPIATSVAAGVIGGRFSARQPPMDVALQAQQMAALRDGGGGGQVMGGDLGRGNGQFARQTIVQTIRLIDGAVVRQEVFSGAPFLMQKAVRELRATTKKLTRANAKIPRRTVAQSKRSALIDTCLDQALSQARKCP